MLQDNTQITPTQPWATTSTKPDVISYFIPSYVNNLLLNSLFSSALSSATKPCPGVCCYYFLAIPHRSTFKLWVCKQMFFWMTKHCGNKIIDPGTKKKRFSWSFCPLVVKHNLFRLYIPYWLYRWWQLNRYHLCPANPRTWETSVNRGGKHNEN